MNGDPFKIHLRTHLPRIHLINIQTAKCSFHNQGFTYISVLILIVVTGIALTEASIYWSTLLKRERETEIIFRGDQIRNAIKSYYKNAPSNRKQSYPNRLNDLLKDPRYLQIRRHLRKLYRDPMSQDGKWGLIYDSKGGVKGIYSKSREKPIKVGNFPSDYEDFEKAKNYSDWKFIYVPKPSKSNGNRNA